MENTDWAMSSGLRKKSSARSGIISRVRGISITPSMITRETCTPSGPTCFAIDWARARCAALAEVKAVNFAPCLTDAVAPMTTMLPFPTARISGSTALACQQPERIDPPGGFEIGELGLINIPEHAGPRIINQNINSSELLFNLAKDLFRRGCIQGVIGIPPRIPQLMRKPVQIILVPGQQGDFVPFA